MTTVNIKPKAKLIGKDGNVFNLLGICIGALENANQSDKADELSERIFNSHSYNEALSIMREYCEVY
jgi:hypothetical protein